MSSLDTLQPQPNSGPKPFLTLSFSSALSSQSKESFAFPFKDVRPRVFHIDGLSEQQQKRIAMVTALFVDLAGFMEPNSKAQLYIR